MLPDKAGTADSQYPGGREYRLFFAIAALVGLAAIFWLSSRYPALNEKALMGGDTPLSGLSFDIAIRILPDSGIVWEIIANTVNWISTNMKGMSFGVLFGAALLTLLSLVKKRSFEGSFANAALGTAIGAPLGVCVNCAAPIALGLHAGRMRLETTLAALLASPTLNIIVITMSFALLPFYLAAIKTALALLMVLVAIPLLCKYVLVAETVGSGNTPANMADASQTKGITAWMLRVLSPKDADPTIHGPMKSLVWFLRNYARNFFFIFIITVPMMFLAALLGALVATITKPNELITLLPHAGIFLPLLAVLAIAIVASFVPAPIALDVILVAILVGIGLKAEYAVAMIIGLGSFSIYAFIILWRAISLRTAVSLWVLVIAFAIFGGILGHFAGKAEQRYDVQQRVALLKSQELVKWPELFPRPAAESLAALSSKIDQQTIRFQTLAAEIESDDGSEIDLAFSSIGAAKETIVGEKTNFARIMGPAIGLDEKGVISPLKIFSPYNMGGGIAAGDVHGDGWTDILTARSIHQTGFSLYANIGGKYIRQKIDLGPLEKLDFRNLALVDINGDQQLDIVGATFEQGVFALFNQGGEFDHRRSVRIDNKDGVLAVGMAFADFDNDGDIDIAFGNWTTPAEHDRGRYVALSSHNNIAWNDGKGGFESKRLPGFPGATLTTLASDFDRDGNIDILIGNDVRKTDVFLMSDGNRNFRAKQFKNTPFPYTMRSSMGYTQGDWNNDLITDYYGAQVAMPSGSNNAKGQSGSRAYDICAQFTADLGRWEYDTAACAERLLSMDFIHRSNMRQGNTGCAKSTEVSDRILCASLQYIKDNFDKRKTQGSPEKYNRCRKNLAHIPEMQRHCVVHIEPRWEIPREYTISGEATAAVDTVNILMTGQADGAFRDDAGAQNVDLPGWSWNSRFTDLDQDGWQDLLIMTGIWQKPTISGSNKFYHNQSGQFADATDSFGFADLIPSFSYVSLDYDRDGDIDVIRDMGSLRMIVHRNDRPAGGALWVHLRDTIGNSMGIGARVTICTNGETRIRPGKCQMRVISASGGFMAFDPIAAHFGLGKAKYVSLIQVKWPDGETTMIRPKSLSAGEIFVSRK
jgi:uncharacterized membrane protein YraQ (UPF0718 family)